MPRKKPAKHVAKRPLKNNSFVSLHKMEKDFSATPDKLATQLDKALSTLQRAEIKLKKHISKLRTQLKHCETRIKVANKAKDTVTGKKQISKMKKIHAKTNKTLVTLNKELQDTTKQHALLSRKQAKFIALRRHLIQFEKNWIQDTKKRHSKKPKVKKTTKLASPLPITTGSSEIRHSTEEMVDEEQPKEVVEAV